MTVHLLMYNNSEAQKFAAHTLSYDVTLLSRLIPPTCHP